MKGQAGLPFPGEGGGRKRAGTRDGWAAAARSVGHPYGVTGYLPRDKLYGIIVSHDYTDGKQEA